MQSAKRKCLHLYFYFIDRDFGLIHVRLQTWFPMQIQVYLNGHEWLARKLADNQIRYTKLDNAFREVTEEEPTAIMEMLSPADDAVARFRRGDRAALIPIVEQYQFRLYRFLLRMVGDAATAEDLFQQTWIRVMEKIAGYDPRYRFDAWLFAVARNLAIDHLRRKPGFSLDAQDEDGEAPVDRLRAPGADALEQVLEFERGSIVAVAMEELPAIHREVLTLRFEEGMKLEEIALVAGIPLATVKSRMHRALEGLRTRVEKRLR